MPALLRHPVHQRTAKALIPPICQPCSPNRLKCPMNRPTVAIVSIAPAVLDPADPVKGRAGARLQLRASGVDRADLLQRAGGYPASLLDHLRTSPALNLQVRSMQSGHWYECGSQVSVSWVWLVEEHRQNIFYGTRKGLRSKFRKISILSQRDWYP